MGKVVITVPSCRHECYPRCFEAVKFGEWRRCVLCYIKDDSFEGFRTKIFPTLQEALKYLSSLKEITVTFTL